MGSERPPFNFERVVRKFVQIKCTKCAYTRGVKNEHGEVKCGMCGTRNDELMTVSDAVLCD